MLYGWFVIKNMFISSFFSLTSSGSAAEDKVPQRGKGKESAQRATLLSLCLSEISKLTQVSPLINCPHKLLFVKQNAVLPYYLASACVLTVYLMMVCIPRTCGVLSRTVRVLGSGWPWWAVAKADLSADMLGRERWWIGWPWNTRQNYVSTTHICNIRVKRWKSKLTREFTNPLFPIYTITKKC